MFGLKKQNKKYKTSEFEEISELISKMEKIKEINCLMHNFEEVVKPHLRFYNSMQNLSLNNPKFVNCIFEINNKESFILECLNDYLIMTNDYQILITKESLFKNYNTRMYKIFKEIVDYYTI